MDNFRKQFEVINYDTNGNTSNVYMHVAPDFP